MRWVPVLLAVLFLVAACPLEGESEYTVVIVGTEGLDYTGSIIATLAGGASRSTRVEGAVPDEYKILGLQVTATIQKQAETGTLKVELYKTGELVGKAQTSDAFGVVSVAAE